MSIAQHAVALPVAKPKRTLENRVNDLSWRDWLLFQKSFFTLADDESLYGDLIQFFTKRYAPDGRTNRVMVITVGVSDGCSIIATHGRMLFSETVAPHDIGRWCYGETDFTPFDFIVIDMRQCGVAFVEQTVVRQDEVLRFFANCRAILREGGFCVLLSREVETPTGRHPLPWILSSFARHSFRLRDERIGLQAGDKAPVYVNVLQGVPEIGPVHELLPALCVGAPAIQQQWVKPKPKPRNRKEMLHPAKFPEELVQMFVSELTEENDVVFDPMGGTGSAGVAALTVNRKAVIIELGDVWAEIARSRIAEAAGGASGRWHVAHGDARNASKLIPAEFKPVAYTITSPPYWRILHNPGMHVGNEGQKARRAKGLRTTYSESEADLGNVREYENFIDELAGIYECCAGVMESGRVLTIVTKNVKFERAQYPIAWDLVFKLCSSNGRFEYAGTTFWCQDDVGLKPFGMGCDWISNVLHNYCLHLRVR
jgi:hypothetical protein